MTMKCLKKSKKKHIQYIILCKDKSSHKDSNTMSLIVLIKVFSNYFVLHRSVIIT